MAKKKEKVEDLKSLSVVELRKQAASLAEELFGLRLQNISGQLENTAKVRQARRQIARVKTMMSQKAQG
jgi:large subunit ribosomal protein L29